MATLQEYQAVFTTGEDHRESEMWKKISPETTKHLTCIGVLKKDFSGEKTLFLASWQDSPLASMEVITATHYECIKTLCENPHPCIDTPTILVELLDTTGKCNGGLAFFSISRKS